MMYCVEFSNEFRKAYKKCAKRGLEMKLLDDLIVEIATNGCAPQECRPHKLSGSYSGYWECHVSANWLLVWNIDEENMVLRLHSTGSHSDIF